MWIASPKSVTCSICHGLTGRAERIVTRLMRPETVQYIMSATKELAELLGISLAEVR